MSERVDIWLAGSKKRVYLRNKSGQQGVVTAKYIINAAGLHAQEVALSLGERKETVPRRYLAKGNYFKLEGQIAPQ